MFYKMVIVLILVNLTTDVVADPYFYHGDSTDTRLKDARKTPSKFNLNLLTGVENAILNPDSLTYKKPIYKKAELNIKFKFILPLSLNLVYNENPYYSYLNGLSIKSDLAKVDSFKNEYNKGRSQLLTQEIGKLDSEIAAERKRLAFYKIKSQALPPDSLNRYYSSTSPIDTSIIENKNIDSIGEFKTVQVDIQSSDFISENQHLDTIHRFSNQIQIPDSGVLEINDTILPSDSIQFLQSSITNLEKRRAELLRKKEEIEHEIISKEQTDFPKGGLGGFFTNHLKSLKLGRFAPDYRDYLFSGISLWGAEVTLEGKYYLAATYGFSFSPKFFSPRLVNKTKNAAFNLGNASLNSTVNNFRYRFTAIKFGLGKESGTHIHLGILEAQNLTDHSLDYRDNVPRNNRVFEIDAGTGYSKYGDWRVIIAKSYNSANVESSSELPQQNLKGGNWASRLETNYTIPKWNLNIKAQLKIRQVAFYSLGETYNKNDNIGGQANLSKKFNQRFTTTIQAYYTIDNSSGYAGKQLNTIRIQDNINIKVNRHVRLILSGGYTSINSYQSETDNTKFQMYNGTGTYIYIPRSKSRHQILTSVNTYTQSTMAESNTISFQSQTTDNFKLDNSILQICSQGFNYSYIGTKKNDLHSFSYILNLTIKVNDQWHINPGISPQYFTDGTFSNGYSLIIDGRLEKHLWCSMNLSSCKVFDIYRGYDYGNVTYVSINIKYQFR